MIPVQRKAAPKGFHAKVYRPGRSWLKSNQLPLRGPVPKDTNGKSIELSPYWRECLDDLDRRYGSICAYVSIYIHPVTGSRSVDHFIAKSVAIEHAYRWSNFRFACMRVNGRKGIYNDVLDPFEIQPETFFLNLSTGKIYPNPNLAQAILLKAESTILRLGLDKAGCRTARLEFFDDYHRKACSEEHLKKHCPFVWYEVHRQKLTV